MTHPALQTILDGNVLGGLLQAWTYAMGTWFYVIVYFMTYSMIYLKTQKIGPPTIFSIIVGSALMTKMSDASAVVDAGPGIERVGFFIIVFGVTVALFSIWRSRGVD